MKIVDDYIKRHSLLQVDGFSTDLLLPKLQPDVLWLV